jgi:Holliday junction resolvase RusA-like endonuclease
MSDPDRGPLSWREMVDLGGLIVPWQPYSKKRPRISAPVAGKARRTHQDPADKAAEKLTREHVTAQMAIFGLPKLTGNVHLVVRFYRQTRQVVDFDNLLKHLLDSLNGVAFVDDSQITSCDVRLELDRNQPRTEFYVLPSSMSTMLRGTDAP